MSIATRALYRGWALLLLCSGALAGASSVTFEVQNGPWERFRQPVAVVLTAEQVQQAAGCRLVEIGPGGEVLGAVPFAVDTSAKAPNLAWVLPGITPAGGLRRFTFMPEAAVTAPASDATDLAVVEAQDVISVGNSFFEVRHPRTGFGGFPDRIVFKLSGSEETELRFIDRLFSRELKRQVSAAADPKATARVVFQSPVRVVIETAFAFRGGDSPVSGNPHAVYRWTYSPFSPVVDVRAVMEQDTEQVWDEQHFLQPSRGKFLYNRFVIGEPVAEKPMLTPGAKSQSHRGSNWAVMATDTDAVGVGYDGGLCWDAANEFVYYVTPGAVKWSTPRLERAGGLYLGPATGDTAWFSRWLGPQREPGVRVVTGAPSGVAAAPAAAERLEGAYELANEALRIVFADAANGLGCLGIENRLAGNVRFVTPRPGAPGLWKLELHAASPPIPAPDPNESKDSKDPKISKTSKDTDDEICTLDNTSAAVCTAQLVKDGAVQKLVLRWQGLDLPEEPDAVDVTASVSLGAGRSASEWTIDIANRSKRWGLWEAQYPLLSTVCAKGTADVLLPHGNWGGSLARNCKRTLTGRYPSGSCPVQFLAFNRGEAGLYFAAHDPGARTKRVVLTADQDATFATYAEGMGVPGSHVVAPFSFVVAAYAGDWWQAARIYRDWAVQQAWTSKGRIADRKDIPLTFKELGFWMLGGGMPSEVRTWMIQTEELFAPIPVGLHWYNWHVIPFDNSYPEYFPTKPDFDKVVRELVGRGQVMMPYINGRLWDRDIPSFEAAGRPGATKKQNGEPNIETYGSGRFLAAMCPTTKVWQDKVNEIVYRLIHECGVNSVYLDQIGAAAPALCFDPSHGHPLGGGRHWVDSYREMLNRTKAEAAANGVSLTTENTAEPYMDNIDGFLAWSPRYDTDVPLLPAIYSGYTIYFTSPESEKDDLQGFVMAQGRDFLWGCQLGWNGTWMIAPEHRAKANFMRKLCRHRLAAKDFLVYGQLLDEIRLDEPSGTLATTWNRTDPHPATLPGVMGTLWRARDGRLGVVLVNFAEETRRAVFTLDPGKWLPDSAAAKSWLWSRVTPLGGEGPLSLVDAGPAARSELLAGREVAVFIVRPALAVKDEMRRARQVLADSKGCSIVEAAAERFLFEQEARELKLEVTLDAAVLTVAEGEPAELGVHVRGQSRKDQYVVVEWPDGEKTMLTVGSDGQTLAKHVYWPPVEGVETAAPQGQADAGKNAKPRQCAVVPAGCGPGKGGDGSRLDIKVRLGRKADAPQRTFRVPLRIVAPVQVTLGAVSSVRSGESFLLPLEMVNNSRSVQSGRLELQTPPGWTVEPSASIDAGKLRPGERRDMLLKCCAPKSGELRMDRLAARFVRDAVVQPITVLPARPEVSAPFLATPPVIDGALNEWGAPVIELGGEAKQTVKITKDYGGADDCSAKVRVAWDAANFYLAAEVQDNTFFQAESGSMLWQGDCIQLAFRSGAPNPKPEFDGTESEVGLTQGPNGPAMFQWMPGSKPVEGGKLAVVRDGNVTRYEAAVPWSALGVASPIPSMSLTWSMTINDNDGQGFHGWLEWTPGICGGKDSSGFGWLRLVK
ncbi:MAG: hypothetical protein A3K19_02545 [Lentisphaerae bacterium RIFOXYB12_FULL_65_16]|nr:MAG: hypothetical protein A3K18_21235 [Lentisphaerae bacterium RIFOXYA12_64_32]OGV93598.1 MAG: hypothetical protein A3K19_02545 [Lentisphaerae bacterium RIFOXYB12_FULL_65_16]